MKQIPASVAAFGIILSLSHCKSRQNESASAKRYEYDDGQCVAAMTFDSKKYSSVTKCRLAALDAYGQAILSQTSDKDDVQNIASRRIFDVYGINASDRAAAKLPGVVSLKEAYSIGPTMGSLCFNDEESTNLYWENWFVDKISGPKKQIEAIAEFVAEHHALMGGTNGGAFSIRRIEFCPISVLKAKMTYSAGLLTIGLPKKLKSYTHYSANELKGMWDRGEFFLDESVQKTLPQQLREYLYGKNPIMTQLWQVLNPTGAVRSNLRMALHSGANETAINIKKYFGKPWTHETIGSVLERLVGIKLVEQGKAVQLSPKTNTPEATQVVYKNVLTEKNLSDLTKVIEQNKFGTFLQEWTCQLDNRQTANEASAIAQAAICRAKNENVKIAYKLKNALVNVANFHHIDVCAAFSYGSTGQYIAPDAIDGVRDANTFSFEVEAEGTVNVVTGDLVNVTALTDLGKRSVAHTIETKGFVEALQSTLGETKSSCQ